MARQLQQSKMLSVAAVSDGPNVHNEFFHFTSIFPHVTVGGLHKIQSAAGQ